jgi:hypothetical protein
MKYFIMLLTLFVSGCAGFKTYGTKPEGDEKTAKVFLLGHTNKLPISAMLKLKSIGGDDVWNTSTIAYDLSSGKYDLYYKFVFITDVGYASCYGASICETSLINWLKHPYKITAELKPNYVYMPILESENEVKPQVCLYGEPWKAKGQKLLRMSKILSLSKNAEKIACGSIDVSITYNQKD